MAWTGRPLGSALGTFDMIQRLENWTPPKPKEDWYYDKTAAQLVAELRALYKEVPETWGPGECGDWEDRFMDTAYALKSVAGEFDSDFAFFRAADMFNRLHGRDGDPYQPRLDASGRSDDWWYTLDFDIEALEILLERSTDEDLKHATIKNRSNA